MKFRLGYVSNSSSSSFVIKTFDKNAVTKLLNNYIKVALNCDDNIKYYKVSESDIVNVINDKLNESSKKQLDHLDTYVKSELWGLFSDILYYYVNQRMYKLSGCKKCEYYKKHFDKKRPSKCFDCYNKYVYTEYKNYYNKIRRDKRNMFNDLDFKNVTQEIKKLVYAAPTYTNNFDHVIVDCKYSDYNDIFDKYSTQMFEDWKKKYPNSYVLNFCSDCGNYAEALLRGLVYNLTHYMKRNGVDGYKGENS